MQFSEQWLREFVNPNLNAQQLAEQLSAIGLEVDHLSAPLNLDISQVVIGQIVALAPHPDADKLKVCQVITSKHQQAPLTIVCGAGNVQLNLKVPVAQVGASLPKGIKIKRAKLRGVESEGMICSAAELGLAETSLGILPLPEDAPLGEDFCTYYQLHDHIVKLDLTPNRGDCLSVLGVARDLAAKNEIALKPLVIKPVPAAVNQTIVVKHQAVKACPKYLSRVIRGIDSQAKTPRWMQERLRRSGVASIHPAVDVTNYVMLELGQPMHAFDLQAIQGAIVVRYAQSGESLHLLNKNLVNLSPADLVIADETKPIALAGIMGGLETAVQPTTQNIVLEAAYFDKAQISLSCQRIHVHSDASHRFERGVDPLLPDLAIERATELILSIAGGQPGEVHSSVSQDHLPVPGQIALPLHKLQAYAGSQFSADQVVALLARLNCRLVNTASHESSVLHFTVPSYRFDLSQDVDLIEEVMRIRGYDAVAASMPKIAARADNSSTDQPDAHLHRAKLDKFKQRLISYGFSQVVNYSFISQKGYQSFYEPYFHGASEQPTAPLKLANPISEDLSVMRPGLLYGLLNNLEFNLNRQKDHIKLFESGNIYQADLAQHTGTKELKCLAGLVCVNNKHQGNWQAAKEAYGFFDLKGELMTALALLIDPADVDCTAESHHSLFHPAQCARLDLSGKYLGYMGALHPRWLHGLKLGKQDKVYAFELGVDVLLAQPEYGGVDQLSKYPAVERDLTLLVRKDFAYQNLAEVIRANAGECLKSLDMISLYAGDGVASAYQAISFRLKWQSLETTLKEQEIAQNIENLLAYLKQQYQIVLKDA